MLVLALNTLPYSLSPLGQPGIPGSKLVAVDLALLVGVNLALLVAVELDLLEAYW
jgi:hypothetical protein